MGRRLMLAAVALGGAALVATAFTMATQRPLYTLTGTRSCLARLPNSIAGLPPARPPVPPVFFVDVLARDDLSTGGLGARPRAHRQLGIWHGARTYEGIILSFFKSVPDARASLASLAALYGGSRIRNVVATWDQSSIPRRRVRLTVLGCLRSEAATGHATYRPSRPARLATFTGYWGGHDRGLSITSTGRAHEFANSSCCARVYQMRFQILSFSGTLTRAAAVYRVTAFRRYEGGVRRLQVGATGKLLLRNGVMTNALTHDFFCSNPAWGATGVCGA